MFPFFSIEHSYRIRVLSIAAARYNVMGRVAQMISLLPLWIRVSVVQYFTSEQFIM